jgi:transposase
MNHWNVVWFPRLLPYQKKEVVGKVSFCVDAEPKEVQQTQESVGIDLGIKAFATMSKNQVFEVLKPLKQAKTKLAINVKVQNK